ncbi:MAG: aminotransferase class V-fold PLP-dependent enzyme [Pseudobdellovibrionaceae bacterium]
MKNYQHLYARFLQAHAGVQHFVSHGHHYWPDATFEAHLQFWQDSCKFLDEKWNHFFSEKLPQAQKLICENLHLSQPDQIVFAANTHELSSRVLSCFPRNKKIRVLTTDSEFYSFDRQLQRLEEAGCAEVLRVPTAPYLDLEERLLKEIKSNDFELIFLSQVFFNSGVALHSLPLLVQAVKSPETLIIIDGYHAFMAVPTDLSSIEQRIFYLAGSYKYAQGGEGCCFMWVPPNCRLRPENTGWFAGLKGLAKEGEELEYREAGWRFAGSTMDYSALYRLIASLEVLKKEGLSVSKIHHFVQNLQKRFLLELQKHSHPLLNQNNLLGRGLDHHGHFLAFQTPSSEICSHLASGLRERGVQTDCRKERLRFGFGLYHDGNYDLSALKEL